MASSSFQHCHLAVEQRVRQYGVTRVHSNKHIELSKKILLQSFARRAKESKKGNLYITLVLPEGNQKVTPSLGGVIGDETKE
jgi:hypothetical protein